MGHGKKFTDNPTLSPEVADRGFKLGITIGAIGLIASLGGLAMGETQQFAFSWLTACVWGTTICLGSLFFVILHHITGAGWSTSFRRIAENITMGLPMMAVFLLPLLLFGMHSIYHWSHADAVAADPILQGKAAYLNPGFFGGRAIAFFVIWIAISTFYRRLSVRQDESGDHALTLRMRWWAPVSTLMFALTISYAGFDWVMSLDPHWFSTMFGVIIFAGSLVAAYATIGLLGLWLQKNGALQNTLTEWNFHDVAKLMFGFTCFWAYTSFSQYMLIWYGNIPEETAWYDLRMNGGWGRIGIFLIVGHFIIPFWVLMSRHVKRHRAGFGVMAAWMLFVHFWDLYYMIMPTLHHHFHLHWLDFTCLAAVGGCLYAFVVKRAFAKDAIDAYRDPQLSASMNYDNF